MPGVVCLASVKSKKAETYDLKCQRMLNAFIFEALVDSAPKMMIIEFKTVHNDWTIVSKINGLMYNLRVLEQ